MEHNSRLFTTEEMSRGMRYSFFFDYEHDKVIVFKSHMSREIKHIYTYKKGCDIINRYQNLIYEREWKRLEEEVKENCEYRYGRKCY